MLASVTTLASNAGEASWEHWGFLGSRLMSWSAVDDTRRKICVPFFKHRKTDCAVWGQEEDLDIYKPAPPPLPTHKYDTSSKWQRTEYCLCDIWSFSSMNSPELRVFIYYYKYQPNAYITGPEQVNIWYFLLKMTNFLWILAASSSPSFQFHHHTGENHHNFHNNCGPVFSHSSISHFIELLYSAVIILYTLRFEINHRPAVFYIQTSHS